MKRKRIVLLTTFLIVMACLVVGYAALQTTLNITGNSNVKGNSWDVHWENVHVNEESTAEEVTPATITEPTQVEFNINLNAPGDYYEFTVDAVNAGTIDAMVNVISKQVFNASNVEIQLPSYLTYEVTYDDGAPIAANQLLAANSSETIKVRVEYKRDISEDELVGVDTTIKFRIGVDYIQSEEETVIPAHNSIYVMPSSSIHINDQVSSISSDNIYETPEELMEYRETSTFLKLNIVDNKVSQIYIGLKSNNNIIYLRGFVDESEFSEQPIYNKNVDALLTIYSSSECSTSFITNYNCYYTRCSKSGINSAKVYQNGLIDVTSQEPNYWNCYARNDHSSCSFTL